MSTTTYWTARLALILASLPLYFAVSPKVGFGWLFGHAVMAWMLDLRVRR